LQHLDGFALPVLVDHHSVVETLAFFRLQLSLGLELSSRVFFLVFDLEGFGGGLQGREGVFGGRG